MSLLDIVLGIVLAAFMFMGFKNGFVKKIISIACLALALVLATKFSADIASILIEPLGVSGRIGFVLAFIVIVVGITLTQSLIYKFLIKDLVDGIWNHIGGLFIGLLEGGLTLSIALILMSIYLHIPSQETKADSMLYSPVKNFAPVVFDGINMFLPESEDFYQQMFESATDILKTGGTKK